MDVGQTCIKTAGREAGKTCVVVDKVDENFVTVTGPQVKRRRCNVAHLEKLGQKLTLKKGVTDSEVNDALLKADLIKKEDIKEKKPPKEKKEQVTAPRKTEVKKEKKPKGRRGKYQKKGPKWSGSKKDFKKKKHRKNKKE